MTLTTETLNLWRNNAEITAGETAEDDPEHIAAKAILALTAELLANREAQPVAWRHDDGPFAGIAITRAKSVADSWMAKGWTVTPLYTAPPAPEITDEAIDRIVVPLSPDGLDEEKYPCEWHLYHDRERIRKELREYFAAPQISSADAEPNEIEIGHDSYPGYVAGWNACRAAMLAQPVSQRYTLPPHVFRELVNSLRDTAVKFSGTEQLRERLNTALSQFIEPDHPHTRTVAPEGGNGA